MGVDTKQVSGRRDLHFSDMQQILDDARLLASHPSRQLGNWSVGTTCRHLAAAINMAVDGAPFRPKWIVRVVGPLIKKRFLSRPMKPGFKLPRSAGTLTPSETEAQQGVAMLEEAIRRFEQAGELKSHIIFGRMTRDEWTQLNLLHSAMHLSFHVPE